MSQYEAAVFEEGKSYPVSAPESAFGAAAILIQVLDEESCAGQSFP